VGAGKEAVGVS